MINQLINYMIECMFFVFLIVFYWLCAVVFVVYVLDMCCLFYILIKCATKQTNKQTKQTNKITFLSFLYFRDYAKYKKTIYTTNM